jgi:hypothetical protein
MDQASSHRLRRLRELTAEVERLSAEMTHCASELRTGERAGRVIGPEEVAKVDALLRELTVATAALHAEAHCPGPAPGPDRRSGEARALPPG